MKIDVHFDIWAGRAASASADSIWFALAFPLGFAFVARISALILD